MNALFLPHHLGLAVSSAIVVALGAFGCGARSTLEGAASSLQGGGGAGGAVSGPSSSSATSSSSTSASTTSSSSGTGGAPACGGETDDSVSVTIKRFDGKTLGCANSQPGSGTTMTSFDATIISSQNGVITFDECSPASDCSGKRGTLEIKARGIGEAYLPSRAFVEIRLNEADGGFFCSDSLLIKNLASWDGETNPVASGTMTWLAATNTSGAFPDAGYAVEPIALHCYPNDPSSCGVHDDYLFRVTVAGTATDIPMGTFTEVGSPNWVFSNIASYTVDVCDASAHFAYVLFVPALD